MILCARSTSRWSEQSTKRRSCSENMWEVCLFYSQNNKIVWLLNMPDTCFEKFTRCAKLCGLFFLDCAFQLLIGWAGKPQSHDRQPRETYGVKTHTHWLVKFRHMVNITEHISVSLWLVHLVYDSFLALFCFVLFLCFFAFTPPLCIPRYRKLRKLENSELKSAKSKYFTDSIEGNEGNKSEFLGISEHCAVTTSTPIIRHVVQISHSQFVNEFKEIVKHKYSEENQTEISLLWRHRGVLKDFLNLKLRITWIYPPSDPVLFDWILGGSVTCTILVTTRTWERKRRGRK